MPYQVPNNIDSNKIFLINFSELKGRYDPQYYGEHFDFHNFIKLSSIAKVSGGKRIPLGKDYSLNPTAYLYLRVADIQDNGAVDYRLLKCIDEDVYNILKRYEVFDGDIAISIAGTIGKIVVIKDIPCNKHVILTENCAKITLQKKDILAEYLQLMLSLPIVQKQIALNYIQTTIPKLGLDRVNGLMLPQYPSVVSQQKIVDCYKSACGKKRQKEQEAETLLQSIYDYLLGELGIQLPAKKTEAFQEKIFTVNYSEICGERLDPKCYSTQITQLKQALINSPYNTHTLKEFIKNRCSGEWGKDESEKIDDNKYTKCLVIRTTEFDNTYNLQLDNSRVKYRWIENSKLSRMNIRPNDLLIEKSGGSEDQPVGRIAILTDDILKDNAIAYSNFIHKITVEGINPMYLYFYLKTMHNIGITDSMQSQTNGIRNLIMREYFNQTIVVPPLSKQQEIVDHITQIRQQAKILQAEGNAVLEQAKQKVEQMIIGQ